jgi:hypothetical protein
MRTLGVILASGALAAAAVVGLIPTASAAPAQRAAAPPPCQAGYTEMHITSGGQNLYLDAEGIGNQVKITDTPTCWHPGDSGSYSYITDNSGNCLNWGHNIVTMIVCNGAQSEMWEAHAAGGVVTFDNLWATHNLGDQVWLGADGFYNGTPVTLLTTPSFEINWIY